VPRLHVASVANRLPDWAQAARAEYLGRMPRGYEVSLIEVRPAAASRLRARMPAGVRIVALDERGENLTTARFATLLGEPTVFVVGAAEGLDPQVRKDAFLLMRLSSLTLPHALAQVVLCEQLYRAATLLTGHPYHRK
jgi:23S rRNA (pseudouridine1915-N3)-methyltransferase